MGMNHIKLCLRKKTVYLFERMYIREIFTFFLEKSQISKTVWSDGRSAYTWKGCAEPHSLCISHSHFYFSNGWP